MSDGQQPDPQTPTGSISAIPADVCLTLLQGASVGRVAFIGVDGRQELLSVNFTVVDREIYFRTSEAGPLSVLAAGRGNVAFGVDQADSTSGQGWNVTARGETMRVTDPEVLKEVEAAGLRAPWAGGDRRQVVRIAIHELDGRRVSRV